MPKTIDSDEILSRLFGSVSRARILLLLVSQAGRTFYQMSKISFIIGGGHFYSSDLPGRTLREQIGLSPKNSWHSSAKNNFNVLRIFSENGWEITEARVSSSLFNCFKHTVQTHLTKLSDLLRILVW